MDGGLYGAPGQYDALHAQVRGDYLYRKFIEFGTDSHPLASNSKLIRKRSIAARVGGLFCTANLEIRQSVPQRPQAYPLAQNRHF